jgi:hypothetical protein
VFLFKLTRPAYRQYRRTDVRFHQSSVPTRQNPPPGAGHYILALLAVCVADLKVFGDSLQMPREHRQNLRSFACNVAATRYFC